MEDNKLTLKFAAIAMQMQRERIKGALALDYWLGPTQCGPHTGEDYLTCGHDPLTVLCHHAGKGVWYFNTLKGIWEYGNGGFFPTVGIKLTACLHTFTNYQPSYSMEIYTTNTMLLINLS